MAIGLGMFALAYSENMEKLKYHINDLSREEGFDDSWIISILDNPGFTQDQAHAVNNFLDSLQKSVRKKYLAFTAVKEHITDSIIGVAGREDAALSGSGYAVAEAVR